MNLLFDLSNTLPDSVFRHQNDLSASPPCATDAAAAPPPVGRHQRAFTEEKRRRFNICSLFSAADTRLIAACTSVCVCTCQQAQLKGVTAAAIAPPPLTSRIRGGNLVSTPFLFDPSGGRGQHLRDCRRPLVLLTFILRRHWSVSGQLLISYKPVFQGILITRQRSGAAWPEDNANKSICMCVCVCVLRAAWQAERPSRL